MIHKYSLYSLNKLKSIKSALFLITLNHYINKKYFLIIIILFSFTSEQNEISLTIEGTGQLNFINEAFNLCPYEVYVNYDKKDNSFKSYDFEKSLNNVKIKFNNKIGTCQSMFEGLLNIIEIDLSNFDASEVTSMASMFNSCINLKKITFGNMKTSSVKNMEFLFYNCTKLFSIDLSNFDTSSVITMNHMFSHCESLLSLDD